MPWDQDDIDNEMFRDYDEDDCDHQFADIDLLEGRGHCPFCSHTWYLSCEAIQAEDADIAPARTTVWCLACEAWYFHDDPPCQNIDCPNQQSGKPDAI